MLLPSFTADQSLYKSIGHYRSVYLESAGRSIPFTDDYTASIWSPKISTNKVSPKLFSASWLVGVSDVRDIHDSMKTWTNCNAPGDPCCGADYGVQTLHCHKGLGCNVARGQCEACGGPGQVCCDGHLTGFSRKGYSGMPWDPTERIESCDPGSRCDAWLAPDGISWLGSRRCQPCGRELGNSCCAPDNRYGLGRCFTDLATGARLTCHNSELGSAGTCITCGQWGQSTCKTGPECDGGLAEQMGKCVPCGLPGQIPCNPFTCMTCDGAGCFEGVSVFDPRRGLCVAAGEVGQPCLAGGKCRPWESYCNPQNICQACGLSWSQGYPLECCPKETGLACSEGKCHDTGVNGQHLCLCGHEGDIPCWNGCQPGYALDSNGICHATERDGGTDGGSWKTCSGKPYTYSTATYVLAIDDANGCVGPTPFTANSPEEAKECARSRHGQAFIDGEVEEYRWSVHCNGSCEMVTFKGRDDEHASRCAHHMFPGCWIIDAECP